ncbi:MAG: hypothetical protein Q4C44_00340 [bacterium]|nr:hypothetical protein [bacterium]
MTKQKENTKKTNLELAQKNLTEASKILDEIQNALYLDKDKDENDPYDLYNEATRCAVLIEDSRKYIANIAAQKLKIFNILDLINLIGAILALVTVIIFGSSIVVPATVVYVLMKLTLSKIKSNELSDKDDLQSVMDCVNTLSSRAANYLEAINIRAQKNVKDNLKIPQGFTKQFEQAIEIINYYLPNGKLPDNYQSFDDIPLDVKVMLTTLLSGAEKNNNVKMLLDESHQKYIAKNSATTKVLQKEKDSNK